ncbi:hypothetical protein PR048_006297 [Dryococelus australis]|uniref:Uncharacterized protein n=1 Tax=Dryococelus australis TaxID=614101 RepID=A0ABQ9IAM6_9NEOP|nr:hypothetical protein PR048_006297 [Dryococelus australis]
MKSVGDLTRGQGVTGSVVSKWVLDLAATHGICMSLKEFCGVDFSSSEQHEDFRESDKARDASDIAKASLWIETTEVMGDNTITYYDAVEVGEQAMAKMVGKYFTGVKLSRKDRAVPLASMTFSVK